MSEPINPLVVDLSHWDPAENYQDAASDGLEGVIYKATQGAGYSDPTYVAQQKQAKAAGLLWGAYHFAEATDVAAQAANFLEFAAPDPNELFCLDWEDYGDNTMSVEQAEEWITRVEEALKRPQQCVIYSGNTAKDLLGSSRNGFFGKRRLWLAQYGASPVCQASWDDYWLWQYTDGVYGPQPQTFDGLDPAGVDVNSFQGDTSQLAAEWSGQRIPAPRPPRPHPPIEAAVLIEVTAPPGIVVKIARKPARRRAD